LDVADECIYRGHDEPIDAVWEMKGAGFDERTAQWEALRVKFVNFRLYH
jgi:hypothetical protein